MRLLIIGLVMTILTSASVAQSSGANSSKEVVIEAGLNPIAHSINIAPDNSFIVAGAIDGAGSAWAIRVDEDGRVQWRITVPKESNEPGFKSAINDSAILENGHTVFCGHIGVDRFSKRPAYLLFLDGDGKKISDKRFYPHAEGDFRMADISKCTPWNKGIIAIGKAVKVRPEGSVPSWDTFYWITFWTPNGELLWEKSFPIGIPQVDTIDSMQTTSDGHVVFCGEGGAQSEIVRIDAQGRVVARAAFPGRYLIIQSLRKTPSVQIIPRNSWMPWELITMDEHLNVVHRTTSGKKLDASLSAAWATGDDAIFAFGERVRNSVPKEAIVIKVKQDLESIAILNMPSLADSNLINAVTYSQTEHRFVMAHRFIRPNSGTRLVGTSLTFLENN